MKNILLFAFVLLFNLIWSQKSGSDIFKRISTEAAGYKIDTTAVPQDRLTGAIQKLRTVKGGFNINEAILYKINEDQSKGDISAAAASELETFFTQGKGKRWLDNAVIRIYREKFSLSEIKQLTRFYKSPAGIKISQSFPLIMIESMKAAETIMARYKSEMPEK